MLLVQTGELIIGTDSKPYENEAIITLLGEPNSPVHSYSNAVVAGNKIFFITGTVTLVGKDVMNGGEYHTRLTQSCSPDDTTIYLGTNLGWKENDEIAIAPTGFDET